MNAVLVCACNIMICVSLIVCNLPNWGLIYPQRPNSHEINVLSYEIE